MSEQTKVATIKVSMSELRNIAQGLDLMHSKCMDNLASIQSADPKGSDLKAYFREKQGQVTKQLIEINKILTGNKPH